MFLYFSIRVGIITGELPVVSDVVERETRKKALPPLLLVEQVGPPHRAQQLGWRARRRPAGAIIKGLFGRAPAPAPLAALAGAIPNTLKMERLHTVAYEKMEQ